ncbi:MAG TPA: carbonic anhydrase [Thermoanaerobaculia bacterium]
MFVDDLLERNRAFVARRQAQPLPPVEAVRLAVVGCYDPRLDPLLRPSLGLAEGQGFLFRTAGALVNAEGRTLRSLALAVYLFNVREIFVLGHTSCRMAAFDTAAFIEAFRRRGVPREGFGAGDLRAWAGAIASPRQGVLTSAAAIAAAPFLPRDLAIAGGVLDDATGEIEVVLRPGETVAAQTPPPGAEPADAAAPPPPPPAAEPLPPALDTLYQTVDFLSGQSHMYAPLAQLRHSLQQEKNPLKQLSLVRQFMRSGAADTQELKDVFTRVRDELKTVDLKDLSQLLQPLLHRTKRS